MPIVFVAIALVTGGLTIVLMWSQGALVALLCGPLAASAAALLLLFVIPRRQPQRVRTGKMAHAGH